MRKIIPSAALLSLAMGMALVVAPARAGATIPLKWTFILEPHDLQRVPEEIRRGVVGS
ncbi:MAG: hypothetical protein O7F11_08600 [Acidobacteria bacterium]|nr:hypothetical protein [Acidobacteriota bacterium]